MNKFGGKSSSCLQLTTLVEALSSLFPANAIMVKIIVVA
jgi:hypothetical protein